MFETSQRGGGWKQWNHEIFWAILILTSMAVCHCSPVYLKNSHHLSHYQSGRNIRHLPCKIRRSGEEGICMFAIDCLKSNGTHLGTCIDRFYFGSCCHIKDDTLLVEPEISDNSIDENTISHFLHQQTHPTGGTVKPTIGGETERPLIPVSTISATTSHNLSPQSSVTALHHHYTNNYDVISQSSSSPLPPTSSSSISSIASSTNGNTSNRPLEETRFTSSSTSSVTTMIVSKTDPISTTTPENVKLSTFQSVEGNTKSPVEETSTVKITTTHSTRYPTRRTTTTSTHPPTTTTTTTITTTTSTPTTTTTNKSTLKPKPKPTLTKRPISTKKPTVFVSTTTSRTKLTRKPTPATITNVTTVSRKPTRKPTISTTPVPPILPTRKKTTTAVPKTTSSLKTTTATESTTKEASTVKETLGTEEEVPLTTLSFVETTKAPRPKPKPTSTIAIVPPSTLSIVNTEAENSTAGVESSVTHSESVTTTSTYRPNITLSSEAPAVQNSTVGIESLITHSETVSTTSPSTTSHPNEISSVTDSTTLSAGLVTWTNIDESEKNITASTTEGWIPLQTIPVDSSSETTPASVTDSITVTTGELTLISSTATPEAINVTEEANVTSSIASDLGQNLTNVTIETTSPIPSLEGIDYKQICGKRMFPEPRIVGGTKASFGRWPWQISLRQWRTSTYLHKCGAALLNENWAITAAHCVDNVPPSDLLLRLGEYDLAEEEEPYGYQERRVQIVASHPQFDPRTFEYDLALLRFYEPVIFQPNIIPVCVPESDENFIGRTAYVTGWGRLYEDGPLPSVLQEVTVPVIENSICEAMYRRAGYIEHIPHIFICAGWKNGGFDSCEGDSGGPMVIQRHDKRFLLAGVISWGIGCAEPNQPGVYTRISEFRDWINQILQF